MTPSPRAPGGRVQNLAREAARMAAVRTGLEEISSTTIEAGLDYDAVMAVVAGCRQALPMTTEDGSPSLTSTSGMDASTVLDVIARLGTFLRHRDKHLRPADDYVPAAEADGLAVLPGIAAVATPRKGRRISKGESRRGVTVLPPEGVARRGPQRRDVSRSFGAIVMSDPSGDAQAVSLWLARTNPTTAALPLTFSEVSYVHFVAQHGFIEDLIGLCQPETANRNAAERAVEQANCAARARLLGSAFDLLETARLDAAAACARLAQGDTSDLPGLKGDTLKARWVHEGEMRDLGRVIDAGLADASRVPLIAPKLRAFRLTMSEQPSIFSLPHIGALTSAQVLRIAEMAGLETQDLGPLKDQIRRGLDALGLATERNRLLPEALACYQAGQEEVFWRACARLAAADPQWRADLDAALVDA